MKTLQLYCCLGLCLVLGSQYANAQAPAVGHFGHVMVGYSQLDMTDLNQGLRDENFQALNNGYTVLGLGYEQWRGKWVFGLDSYNFMAQRSKFQDFSAVLAFHYALIRVGYTLPINSQEWRIFPTIGFGGGIANLKARKASEVIPTGYFAGGSNVEVAIRARRYFELDPEKNYKGEFGLSLGYLYVPDNQWNLKRFGVNDRTFQVNPQGWFIRATLGMGSFKK